MRYVLWFDPGVTTGIALYDLDARHLITQQWDFSELVTELEVIISTVGDETVVGVERFVLTAQSARRHGSVEAIQAWGAIRSAAVRWRALRFVDTQTSSAALPFCPDRTLRALGWYRPGRPHANDAARHVFRFLAGEGLLTPQQAGTMFTD